LVLVPLNHDIPIKKRCFEQTMSVFDLDAIALALNPQPLRKTPYYASSHKESRVSIWCPGDILIPPFTPLPLRF